MASSAACGGAFAAAASPPQRNAPRAKGKPSTTAPATPGTTYRDYTFSYREQELAAMPTEALSRATIADACPYGASEPPVLFGHYWMPGDCEPVPLAHNVACLDYSVAKGGRLCAYRWNGEATLRREGFVSVPGSVR